MPERAGHGRSQAGPAHAHTPHSLSCHPSRCDWLLLPFLCLLPCSHMPPELLEGGIQSKATDGALGACRGGGGRKGSATMLGCSLCYRCAPDHAVYAFAILLWEVRARQGCAQPVAGLGQVGIRRRSAVLVC